MQQYKQLKIHNHAKKMFYLDICILIEYKMLQRYGNNELNKSLHNKQQ